MLWNDDTAYSMTLVKHLTVPIGAWPLQEYNKFALLRHILSSFGLTVAVIVQYLELYFNCTSATANLDALTLFACGIVALTKIISFRIYADNLICNYSSAMNDYLAIDTEEKRIIMRKHAFWGRIICIFAIFIAYVDSGIFIVGHAQLSSEEAKTNISILGHQAGYAIPSTCTLAHFHISTSSYLVIFVLEYVCLIIMCLSNHGSDSVFLHIVLHVCGQLKILKASFVNFDVESPKVHERFNALIRRHDHLIRMTRKLAEIISFVLVVQFFVSSMLIIIVGFQFIIALTSNDFGMVSKSFMVLSAFLVQLTLYSVVGDYLKVQMEEVAQSVYQSGWYDLPVKVTKNIVFIMMWNQLPIKLQAGNFIVVDLGTYMSILKTSISYLSVLRVMTLILLRLPRNVELYSTITMPRNDDVAYAMDPLKFLTVPLGIWPLQKYGIFPLIRSIVSVFSLVVWLITLFLEVNYSNSDAYVKLDQLMLLSCAILSTLKIVFFRLYADNLICNFFSAVSDYLAIDTEEKRTIMRRHAFIGRMISYSTISLAYVAATMFILLPMLSDENAQVNVSKKQAADLPLPMTWILGEYHFSTSLYYTIFIVQYYLLLLNANANVGNDSLFLAIVLHICGQMEFLKTEFTNYGVKSKNLNEDFLVLISRHRYLMEHAERLVDVISFVLLVQVLISCIIICVIGLSFIVALKTHDMMMITKCGSVLSALLLQLFFYSFVSDYLKCQMEDVAHSIYSCDWYSFPLKLMKNVLFVIMRSQQPIQLLAGKFFVVNIETYMTILKTSMSYLSVLRVMIDT
ncbi:uncharacterized protein LOC105206746 [Solenopsis invicta]|uniref:uncharacterized protein LOC105206746 n=1 Tax=Solenopsis invicta TaxID=13686 RepID=UPI00193E17D9|nr:uncharacterized protein LOC105206746 [Solenopsis invicta]